jgi:hypothetical protein
MLVDVDTQNASRQLLLDNLDILVSKVLRDPLYYFNMQYGCKLFIVY